MQTPKQQFLANKGEAGKFGEIMDNPLVAKAITYAMAELSMSLPSSEMLKGAGEFVHILSTLHMAVELPVQYPERTLKAFDVPITTPK